MIYRIDVRPAPRHDGFDPVGQAIRQQIQELGLQPGGVRASRIFLLDSDAPLERVQRAATSLLADPIVEQAELMTAPPTDMRGRRIEVHLKPGVMDPVAASTLMALADMGLEVREIRTGRAFLMDGELSDSQLKQIAARVLANGVIESVHFEPFLPRHFARGQSYEFALRHVSLLNLDDAQLQTLSRQGHLFLSLAEMKSIQAHFRTLGREPTDVELETLAQTWSEHCVHKTLKSAVDVEERDAAGKVIGHRHYDNLIRDTPFQSTMVLMGRHPAPADMAFEVDPFGVARDFCLSVFVDNAGVIAFDETDAVCFKVETHNHPSAIEPYGGSATGVGGVIRDILGTGLAARPVANTDVFCVAPPTLSAADLPRGVIHPKRILQQVVAGVRDYGNRMGIPTVNGAVCFDERYVGNPLVFCGCVGLLPRNRIDKAARPGDAIVVMGGRTGRDGIHGATFSSAELTDTHADEFSHAVQIGNAITEKKVADVILQARDRELFTGVTDCGAGGLSSAIGEMAEKIGATVHLDSVPLKYDGLRYDEIWISEAQERMVLSAPPEHLESLLKLAAEEDVEATVIGRFGRPDHDLVLTYQQTEVGRLAMEFLHKGIPQTRRKAMVQPPAVPAAAHDDPQSGRTVRERLLAMLAHPNIASKHWIIRQYDHEVQGGSVIKPLVGPRQLGPSDAAVIRPKLASRRGVALACGLAPHIADPYDMTIAAVDEAVRNAVCVGADPDHLAILDNFCWPSVDDERTMGDLVRCCEACRDAALAYRVPFISGKDSLHNQFTNSETGQVIRIPNTLLISAIGVIANVDHCITMDLKTPGDHLYLVGGAPGRDLAALSKIHRTVAAAIAQGGVRSSHDVSEGGPLTAATEMCIASGLGLAVPLSPQAKPFDEGVGQYLLEIDGGAFAAASALFSGAGVRFEPFGRVLEKPHLVISDSTRVAHDILIDELTRAWRGTLDW